MQASLSDEFKEDPGRKRSFPDRAIKSFREKVRIKSERKSGSMLKMASSFFVVTVLAVAAVTVTKMDDLKKVRQTLNASDNAAENEAQDHIYMDTAGMGENTNTPAGDSLGVQNTGMPDSENSGGMPESTAVSAGRAARKILPEKSRAVWKTQRQLPLQMRAGRLREVSVQTERNLHQMPSQAET